MQRILRHRRLVLSTVAALGFGLLGPPEVVQAQVTCNENAPNSDFRCGTGSTASPGTGNTAVGINAKATADATTAYGADAIAGAIAAIAVGKGANASNQGSVAIGQGAVSSAPQSTAVGFAARGLGNIGVAIGDTATAGANFTTAVGGNAVANFPSSAAIGFQAQSTANNQMMFGIATNTYTTPGINSAASKAVQKGRVRIVTVDADGNLASAPMPICRCPRLPIAPRRGGAR